MNTSISMSGLTGAAQVRMDAERIAELMDYLPTEWFVGLMPLDWPEARRRQEAEKRRAKMRYDPAFGWWFAELHAQRDLPLPVLAMDDALVDAHRFLSSGVATPDFARMLAIAGHPLLAPAVRALLVASDANVDAIAAWLGEQCALVDWFALLLWNCPYRREERAFLLAQVFPTSRLAALDQGSAPTWERSLLQLAWVGGMSAVWEALGAQPGSGDFAATLDDLETALVREASQQARMGGYARHQHSPALREATRLVHAKKLHELQQPPPPKFGTGGLEDISRRHYVSEEIMAHAKRANAPAPEHPGDAEIRAKLRSVRRKPAGETTVPKPGSSNATPP